MIPDPAELREALADGRRGRLAAVRLPRAQSGRRAGARARAGSTPGGCSCCCRGRASRWRWRTGSSCSGRRGFPGGCCPTPAGRSCTRRWARSVAGQAAGDGDLARGCGALSRPGAVRRGRAAPPAGRHGGSLGAAGEPVRRRLERRGGGGPPVRGRGAGRGGAGGAGARGAARPARGSPSRRCRRGWSRRRRRAGWCSTRCRSWASAPNSANPHYEPHAGPGRDAASRARWCCWISGPGGAAPRCSPTRPGWGSPAAGCPSRGGAGVGDRARRARRGGRRRCAARPPSGGRSRGSRPTARRAAVIEAAGFGDRVRAPDRPLDRPRPARLGAAPRRLRDPRRPAAGARASGSRWSRASICRASSGCGAR